MLDIRKVAAKAGITNEDDLELYGKYKAKISDEKYVSNSSGVIRTFLGFVPTSGPTTPASAS